MQLGRRLDAPAAEEIHPQITQITPTPLASTSLSVKSVQSVDPFGVSIDLCRTTSRSRRVVTATDHRISPRSRGFGASRASPSEKARERASDECFLQPQPAVN